MNFEKTLRMRASIEKTGRKENAFRPVLFI